MHRIEANFQETPTASTWRHKNKMILFVIQGVCVTCVLSGSFRGMGAFYSKTEIEETSLTQHCWPELPHLTKWGIKHYFACV